MESYLDIKCPHCGNVENWPSGYFETETEHPCLRCAKLFLCKSDGIQYVTQKPDDGYVFKNPPPTRLIPLLPVEIKRQEALHAEARKIAAQLELDQVKPAYDTAKAKYDAAKAQLDEEWANDTTGAIAKYTIASNAVNDADKQLRAAVVSLYNEEELWQQW